MICPTEKNGFFTIKIHILKKKMVCDLNICVCFCEQKLYDDVKHKFVAAEEEEE